MKNKKMNPKVIKALGIAANVLTAVIVIIAVLLAISTLASKGKQYVNLLGVSFLSVASDSMAGDNKDSFDYGDVIAIKILGDNKKDDLEVGQIITFYDQHIRLNGEPQLNTHRIVEVKNENGVISYVTKGDNKPFNDNVSRPSEDVVGVYIGKANGIGKALLWMQTKDGFLTTVVVPSALVFVYCLVMVIMNVMSYSKNKVMRDMADKEAEKEADMRERILKELQEQKKEDKSN